MRAIGSLAQRREVDLTHLLAVKFEGRGVDELTVIEASELIDFLKSLPSRDAGY